MSFRSRHGLQPGLDCFSSWLCLDLMGVVQHLYFPSMDYMTLGSVHYTERPLFPPTNFFFIIAYWFPGDNRFSSEGRCCCLQGGSLMICAAYNHRGMDPKLVKFKSLCEAINTEIVERHKRILPEGDSTNRSISE